MLKEKRQIVILPTNKESQLAERTKRDKSLVFHPTAYHIDDMRTAGQTPQHLYILSNEEIKEGNIAINTYNNINTLFRITKVFTDGYEGKKLDNNDLSYGLGKTLKKVIASTDKSLIDEANRLERQQCGLKGVIHLPQIRESVVKAFIEDYNKGKQWEYVNVEYEEIPYFDTELQEERLQDSFVDKNWRLKLREDNTVIVSPIKEIFTREEMRQNMLRAWCAGADNPTHLLFQEWFDNNF